MIKTHRDLADFIAGKKILHCNSLGKDSILCLEWLYNFAHTQKIVSVIYRPFVSHPQDEKYLNFIKNKYPLVEFHILPNPIEATEVLTGIYQSPIGVMKSWNHQEYDTFDLYKMTEDLRVKFECDYICYGISRSDSFDRAVFLHKNGLVDDKFIYPLGMMSKKDIYGLIKSTGIKLHPTYKLTKSTLDAISYYKMRSTFIAYPEYKKQMYEMFPLLALDEYRFEVLLK